jgi:tetratricopeptide (TPR) repeat protein
VRGKNNKPSVKELKARSCYSLATLLQQDQNAEALRWVNRGLHELGPESKSLWAAELYLMQCDLYSYIGKYQEACEANARGRALLPDPPTHLHIRANASLGTVCSLMNDFERGRHYTQDALKMATALYDYYAEGALLTNLAFYCYYDGKWPEAIHYLLRGLTLTERTGSHAQRAQQKNTLGFIYCQQGRLDLAATELNECEALARKERFLHTLAGILNNKACLMLRHLRRWQVNIAQTTLDQQVLVGKIVSYLDEVEDLARQQDFAPEQCECLRHRAELHLALEHYPEALQAVEQALLFAIEHENDIEHGILVRVKADVELAQGAVAERIIQAYEESLQLLTLDRYETARTQVHLGRLLLKGKDAGHGKSHLHNAETTFAELDAQEDLVEVRRLLE